MPEETDLSHFGVPRALIHPQNKNFHTFKCKKCGKFFAADITADGQLEHCPECQTTHVIRAIYRAVLPGEVGA